MAVGNRAESLQKAAHRVRLVTVLRQTTGHVSVHLPNSAQTTGEAPNSLSVPHSRVFGGETKCCKRSLSGLATGPSASAKTWIHLPCRAWLHRMTSICEISDASEPASSIAGEAFHSLNDPSLNGRCLHRNCPPARALKGLQSASCLGGNRFSHP